MEISVTDELDEYGLDCEIDPNRKSELDNLIKNTVEKLNYNNKNKTRVFVSSTKQDLIEVRWAVITLLKKMGFELKSMEYFGARSDPPIKTCLTELSNSDIYICILGMRYGSKSQINQTLIKKHDKKSYTEIEYDKAFNDDNIPVLAYCINEKKGWVHPINVDKGDDAVRLEKFKDKVKMNHTIYEYKSTEKLIQRLSLDIILESDKILVKKDTPVNITSDNTITSKSKPCITVTTDSDSLYIGHSLNINGISINTGSDYVYIHILNQNKKVVNKYQIRVKINKDSTWSYTLTPNDLIDKLDTGEYIINASSTSEYNDENNIFSTALIVIRQGFISSTTSSSYILPGITPTITGTAITKCPYVYVWLLTQEKLIRYSKVKIDQDDTYSYKFPYGISEELLPGKSCFCISQMPRKYDNGEVRLLKNKTGSYIARFDDNNNEISESKIILGSDNRAENLFLKIPQLIDESYDICTKLNFLFIYPHIDSIDINNDNYDLTISGFTNIPVGVDLNLEIVNADLNQPKLPILTKYYLKTVAGTNNNTFTAIIHHSLNDGKYIARIILASTGEIIKESNFEIKAYNPRILKRQHR